MKLHVVAGGPPSLAVQMALAELKIPYELVNVDYLASDHLTDEYFKMNPQKEIPVLDDKGFFLSESAAILQYLCDKYRPESSLYPRDPTHRAIVNQRLCFNMGFYYNYISQYAMAPIFFDFPRTESGLKKLHMALAVLETYLQRGATKYAAGDNLTLADLALISSTICVAGLDISLDAYPLVSQWYEMFKKDHPELWAIADEGLRVLAALNKNPPNMSHVKNPLHPVRGE